MHFTITVSKYPDLKKSVIYDGTDGEEAYPDKDWVVAKPPLEPATQYFWNVYAHTKKKVNEVI